MENRMNRPIARVLVWSTLALATSLPAYAQNFPDRPVHLIIPYGPGGITDFAGRVLAQKIGED
jgi:tripartite-type tricarboxylate transporter receptor subunit TctC